jgi:hypothetical protein
MWALASVVEDGEEGVVAAVNLAPANAENY